MLIKRRTAGYTLFGHAVYGRRIVFALDYSGSMNTPFGRVRTLRTAEADRRGLSGRERWEFITKPDKHNYKVPTLMERVVHETKKVVASLPESTEFSIVCFAHRLYELDGGLQKATPVNKDKAIDWLSEHQRGRDNEDPMLCFQRLAEISPDTVYFLSDGQFDPGIVRQVTAMNSAVVNTLGIGERKGHQNLMNLAVYSGGRFREIRYDR